jgi:hypothetical protein
MKWYELAFLWVGVFAVFAAPSPPKTPEVELTFGYTEEEWAVRERQIAANLKPYVRQAPIFGEDGYGSVTVNVEGSQTTPSNKPILVTPVYTCEQSSWLSDVRIVYQYRPCGSPRNPWWTPY